ncbi:MAG: DUF4129 domain-containing protein [Terracidiphilus sp.]|jgi:hypothetical protein
MSSSRPGFVGCIGSAPSALVLAAFALLSAAPNVRAQQFIADAGWRDVTVDDYTGHLRDLDALVAACQAQRAAAGSVQQNAPRTHPGSRLDFPACDPAQVGPDDRVQWTVGSPSREVRYDWLRSVLQRAAKKDTAAQTGILKPVPGAKAKPPTLDPLLTQARQRLQEDLKQTASPAQANPDYSGERKSLNAILAQKAYKGVTELTPRERFLEWFYNQLDKLISGLVGIGARAPWIGTALLILLISVVCTALILLLVRIERRGRARFTPDVELAPGAPSAREWQLWLRDAQATAAKGQWREAIHSLYWASISRLESRRLWPADRARTPREYLSLLPGADPRKPALAELTREFERTWYGGRAAAAPDFDAALKQAAALGVAAE